MVGNMIELKTRRQGCSHPIGASRASKPLDQARQESHKDQGPGIGPETLETSCAKESARAWNQPRRTRGQKQPQSWREAGNIGQPPAKIVHQKASIETCGAHHRRKANGAEDQIGVLQTEYSLLSERLVAVSMFGRRENAGSTWPIQQCVRRYQYGA